MADAPRRYSEDEVRAILDRALRQEGAQGVAHDDLVAAASEVGISRQALDAAIRELEGQRGEAQIRAAILERRRQGFRGHLTTYLAVNALLVGINLVSAFISGVFVPWALFPAMGWGLALFFHARAAYSKEVSERELGRELARLEKRERKLEKERQRLAEQAQKRARRQKLEKSAEELGVAVEKGVADLLGAIAREIDPALRGGARGDRREAGPSAPPGPGPGKVRVAPGAEGWGEARPGQASSGWGQGAPSDAERELEAEQEAEHATRREREGRGR